jgi:hypothetical protein
LGWPGAFAFQVGDHPRADGWANVSHPFGEWDRAAWAGKLINDSEVKQHPLGVADRREVVMVALADALVAVVAGRGEGGQIGHGELVQVPSGLDEQPGRHRSCHACRISPRL